MHSLPMAAAIVSAMVSVPIPASPNTPAQVHSYEAIALPIPPGCSTAVPGSINDLGQIVLICSLASAGGGTRSFIWDAGQLVRIPPFNGAPRQEASDINNQGHVSGSSWDGFAKAWIWRDGLFTRLGSIAGPIGATASFSLNENSQQTGWSVTPIPAQGWHAYIWSAGRITDLGELPEGIITSGEAINNAGQVTGTSSVFGGRAFEAFVADTTMGMHGIGTLGKAGSMPRDINGAGKIVGNAPTGQIVNDEWVKHAFVWHAGVMRDLGTLAGHEISGASAINAAGAIVGWSGPMSDWTAKRAVLWRNNTPVDLNSTLAPGSGWVLEFALSINNLGQIIGRGLLNGEARSFLLNPRP